MDVPYKQATDHRILISRDRSAPITVDPCAHLLDAVDAVCLSEKFPRLGDLESRRVAEEPASDHLVMRVVSLEEERLPWRQHAELSTAARLPEVHLSHVGPIRHETKPVAVGNAHVSPHEGYCALVAHTARLAGNTNAYGRHQGILHPVAEEHLNQSRLAGSSCGLAAAGER